MTHPKILILGGAPWGRGGGNRTTAKSIYDALSARGANTHLDDPVKDIAQEPQKESQASRHNYPSAGRESTWADIRTYVGETYPEIDNLHREIQGEKDPVDKARLEQEDARLLRLIQTHDPAVICSVPPTPIDRIRGALKACGKPETPIVAVISDPGEGGIYDRWIHGADAVVVPSDESYRNCLTVHRVPQRNLHNYGFPLSKKYQELRDTNPKTLRHQLSEFKDNKNNTILPADLGDINIALLAGGSRGLQSMKDSWVVANSPDVRERVFNPFHLVTVTGDNEDLYQDLKNMQESLPEQFKGRNTVLAYCDKMAELTSLAKANLGKGGGLAVMESGAFPESRMLLVPQTLPGAEAWNEKFVTGNGFGVKAKNTIELAEHLIEALNRSENISNRKMFEINGAERTGSLLEEFARGERVPAPWQEKQIRRTASLNGNTEEEAKKIPDILYSVRPPMSLQDKADMYLSEYAKLEEFRGSNDQATIQRTEGRLNNFYGKFTKPERESLIEICLNKPMDKIERTWDKLHSELPTVDPMKSKRENFAKALRIYNNSSDDEKRNVQELKDKKEHARPGALVGVLQQARTHLKPSEIKQRLLSLRATNDQAR